MPRKQLHRYRVTMEVAIDPTYFDRPETWDWSDLIGTEPGECEITAAPAETFVGTEIREVES